MSPSGVFFVATGDRCRREAAEAVRFLRRANPLCNVTVFVDDAAAWNAVGKGLADVVVLDDPKFSFIDKIAGFQAAPYVRNIFLDTDAFLAGDADDLFRLLDRFDLAAAHAPGRSGARFHPYESEELPPTFPQLNTGVVAFRRSAVTRALFARWIELYEANPHHRHDQPSLRQAAYESGVSVTTLPPEWNYLGGSAYLSGPLQVLHVHGLTADAAASTVAALNAATGPRVVLPSGEVVAEAVPEAAPVLEAAPVPVPKPVEALEPRYCIPARADLPDLFNRLGLLGAGVEVGVKEGKFSATILERWQGELLISVDPWSEAPSGDYVDIANVSQQRHEEFLATTTARLAPFGERSAIWRMTGDEAAAHLPDGSLDFVYIDARHDYESVKSDLAVWLPKLAPAGVICGHDYVDGDLREGVFGVRSAVDEFFGELGLAVGFTTDEPATFPSWLVALPGARRRRVAA